MTAIIISLSYKLVDPRGSQHVSTEILWTFSLLPFEISLAVFSRALTPPLASPTISVLFGILEGAAWSLPALVALYGFILFTLATLARLTVDKDIWFRDISGSLSPFPLSCIIERLRNPTTTRIQDNANIWPSVPREDIRRVSYCLPGCNCNRKLHLPPRFSPSSSSERLISCPCPAETLAEASPERVSRLIRTPTPLQRMSVIELDFTV
ncbi:hypothetical protein JAAARDRAFT_200165 [Jaapia argillacea MUCL 33604]|uniref:Uncharacterized protein n=1 Tax=Jaapia argillacea MUCL 33604 TaxID=933084 RepID=A0A067P665_9AGAM|nr:hypothetical protein JAAARDRAFT_200165 [Jaapia argillacea MUCL 33604]